MALPITPLSFSDLRRVIGPNNAASISLGQCRPSFPPAYGKGVPGVSNTNIAISQFRGKTKLNTGFTFRAFKKPAYTFSAGSGGSVGDSFMSGYYNENTGTYTEFNTVGGGGGAGGILVNVMPSPYPSNSIIGGTGGFGYGAGGGGSGGTLTYGGGGGGGGFVYLYLNGSESFFTYSANTIYCDSSGILKFIMIGAGASGGNATSESDRFGGAGGASGNLNYGNITVTSGTAVEVYVTAYGPDTSIVVNGTTYSAAGGGGGVAAGGAAGQGGGNSGTGSQGATYFNNGINHVSSVGGYFADNISLFNTYIAHATGITTNMTNLTSATNSIYTTGGSSTNFSIEWVGKFYPPTTGSYTFYLNTDDASYLWIGSNATSGYTTANANINNGALHGMVEKSYTVALTGGTLYPIRIQYGQKEGGYDLQFSFTGPGIGLTNNFDGYIYN